MNSRKTVDHPRTPSPPLPPSLKRRQSVSMPGSLYPRSPSIMPDSPPLSTGEEGRHVRFAPAVCSPHSSWDAHEAGPSRPWDIPKARTSTQQEPMSSSSFSRRASGSQSSSASPLRPKSVSSVKDAVSRFTVGEADADASILLPKETIVVSPGKGKGKEKARDGEHSSMSSREKGRGRAQELELIETSKEIHVQGKERELLEAREEQTMRERRWERDRDKAEDIDERRREDEREREKDKDRIRMLEEEIQQLKEEVCARDVIGVSFIYS
jgi:hypothetical protein